MRKLLIVSRTTLTAMLLLLLWLLLFHSFSGTADYEPAPLKTATAAGTAPTLEQMRAWSDFIVQRNLFSPQRGTAAPSSVEAWSKEDPGLELVAVFGGKAGFVPAGADRGVTPVRWAGPGESPGEKVTVVEIRQDSVLVRKPDGLREMKLLRAAAGAVKVNRLE